MLNIYEYPTCTTCKKAKKLLTEKNIDANYYNVKKIHHRKKILKKY